MFIRHNKTTLVPAHFEVIVSHIIENLKLAIQLLEDKEKITVVEHSEVEIAQKKYEEESGGLLNSIKKLKVILWGEGSSKFLDKKREQYQKK